MDDEKDGVPPAQEEEYEGQDDEAVDEEAKQHGENVIAQPRELRGQVLGVDQPTRYQKHDHNGHQPDDGPDQRHHRLGNSANILLFSV